MALAGERAGRCNRTGLMRDAELWWVLPAQTQPYEQADIDAFSAELARLGRRAVTGKDLLSRVVAVTEAQVAVLRRTDFTALVDTAPDLSGADVDIAIHPRCRGPRRSDRLGDLDDGSELGAPPAEARAPAPNSMPGSRWAR